MVEEFELLKLATGWAQRVTQAPAAPTVFGERPKKTGFGSEFSTPGNRTKGIVDPPKPKRKSDDFKPLKRPTKKSARVPRVPTPGQAFLQGAGKTVVEPLKGAWGAIPKGVKRFGFGSLAIGGGLAAAAKLYNESTRLQEEQDRLSDLNLQKNLFQYGLHHGSGPRSPNLIG